MAPTYMAATASRIDKHMNCYDVLYMCVLIYIPGGGIGVLINKGGGVTIYISIFRLFLGFFRLFLGYFRLLCEDGLYMRYS